MVNYARLTAQRYLISYGEQTPIEHLVQVVCDLKQGYTQFGGLRPFGVSFLYAGALSSLLPSSTSACAWLTWRCRI